MFYGSIGGKEIYGSMVEGEGVGAGRLNSRE